MGQYTGIVGVVVLLGTAWMLSTARRKIQFRIVCFGVSLQFLLAFVLIGFEPARYPVEILATGVTKLLGFSRAGGEFLFGQFTDGTQPWGFVFAVQVLPTIVFFASLMAILYHLGIMQRVVAALAWVLRMSLGVSGAEALAASANIFVGQTEAPLCIKPYLPTMTRSQIMLVMTSGFATIAGSVLAAFVGMLGGADEASQLEFAKHLLTASVMSAPGAFVIAKIMMPETEPLPDETRLDLGDAQGRETVNMLDAAAAGATDGLRLALNVAAMLVAFVALIALIDWPLGALHGTELGAWLESSLGLERLSLIGILGLLFSPVAVLMGIGSADAFAVGQLLGTSMVATEFLAYARLSDLIGQGSIDHRSAVIVTYALCGFANFPSIAIQIGGLTAIAPERRSDFARIGPRAMLAGAMTCWMTGCIAGVFIR